MSNNTSSSTDRMRESLGYVLGKRGLAADPKGVVGRTFIFGKGQHVVAGTVLSVGFGPTEGVSLYVTTPRFLGKEIRCIARKEDEDCWHVISKKSERVDGKFALL